jgi:hypothetical protein
VCRWFGVKDNKHVSRNVCDRTRWRNMIANMIAGRAHDDDDNDDDDDYDDDDTG